MNPDDLKKRLLGSSAADTVKAVSPAFQMHNLDAALASSRLPDSVTNPARWTHKRLAEYIKDFEDQLDEEHEIGARLVTFGQSVTFHISSVGYYGPDIISFDGVNDKNERVQLIQHVSQLSVLLVAVKKLGQKPRRIGFISEENDPNA